MAELLSSYIGRQIEVYLPNQFLEGTLLSVGDNSFLLAVRNGSYVDPAETLTIFYENVESVRVLSLATA
ncbi:hypothetical protein [Sutcliffiella cohnii]|uniref:hypothetical protein n=1 Tax=Sutcliffiella cohnii TaxID=33932 RepID=UPI002E21E142|nr:hypothetical protein [Sutcliffiella cohnii]